jgi:hypothetical protein
MHKPVFIALVGISPVVDALFELFQKDTDRVFPRLKVLVLESPFKDYSTIKIGNKHKSDFSPCARTFLRWAFFYEHNEVVVKPAFESGADIIIIRQYGFDLHMGAIALREDDRALAFHHMLVPQGVTGLGIDPPLYVFTEHLDERTLHVRTQYFGVPGQEFTEVEPTLCVREKATRIALIAQGRLEKQRESAAA